TTTGLSATGRVVWDETRKWLLGYNQFLGKYSIFDTKLWDILNGLLLLQKQGYDKVIIQFDNLEVVEVICDSQSAKSSSSLIRRIQHILLV
ncbi:hypothetical protein J1N35_025385, partial [Gossypium stocksii]